MSLKQIFTIGLLISLVSGCSEQQATAPAATTQPPADFTLTFRQALETAQPGDVIEVPAGTHSFKRSLVLNTDNVTIRGAGMDQSILSFKGQIAGAEGLSVSASDFVIEDLAIEDTVGDALKVNEGDNITIRRVRTEWTNGPDVNNGAYGIYPVQTTNVLVEENVAIAASDAGIYVGQSQHVVVRNNRAEYNVAGIEIENTIDADVYDNVATNNTGGILVFNMPQIPQRGHSTRVYKNEIHSNNTANFAAAGTAVSGVPAGSGVIINSNDKVEIFDNNITNNNTANIVISSYFSANYAGQRELVESFDPYPEDIFIYGNQFEGGGTAPGTDALTQIRNAVYGSDGEFPDIIWDGVMNPQRADEQAVICVQNGDVELLNIDAANEYANPNVNMGNHDCTVDKLSPVTLSMGI
ncbi:MAG: right-handed parallel beta-helix repeat-containing protein [Pseudomonadaceae bacterium]|nr:right-handed parallel beta-helix repeat-containing protein [Pseudomonadaceae bacterium]